MDADFVQKLKRKLRIKWRVLLEKPRFVLGYVLNALFTWFLGLAIAIVGVVLFPALASSGVRLPSLSEIVSADKVTQFAGSIIENLRQFSLSGLFRFVREELPADLRRLFVNLCDFVKRWREFLGKFIALLMNPRKLCDRLHALWERYHVKIKIVATKALGIAISFLLFRLLMYLAPHLGKPFVTIWGINAGIFVLQWCIMLVSPPLARKLRTALGNLRLGREKQRLHATGETFIANVKQAAHKKQRGAETTMDMGGTGDEKENQDSGRGFGAADTHLRSKV